MILYQRLLAWNRIFVKNMPIFPLIRLIQETKSKGTFDLPYLYYMQTNIYIYIYNKKNYI